MEGMNDNEKQKVVELFNKAQMKKSVFNTCINAAISKAKLSGTLISADDVEDIINQLEKLKK